MLPGKEARRPRAKVAPRRPLSSTPPPFVDDACVPAPAQSYPLTLPSIPSIHPLLAHHTFRDQPASYRHVHVASRRRAVVCIRSSTHPVPQQISSEAVSYREVGVSKWHSADGCRRRGVWDGEHGWRPPHTHKHRHRRCTALHRAAPRRLLPPCTQALGSSCYNNTLGHFRRRLPTRRPSRCPHPPTPPLHGRQARRHTSWDGQRLSVAPIAAPPSGRSGGGDEPIETRGRARVQQKRATYSSTDANTQRVELLSCH